jgi:hypothetical protein
MSRPMKPHSYRSVETSLALGAILFSLAFASVASQTRTKSPAKAPPATTNAAPAQPEIPRSVFTIPTTPQEGKDPFFPRSKRLFATAVVKTNLPPPAVVVADLYLNGISGTPEHRLAIVNNQTFAANEEGEVPTDRGRAHIRCLEIKADSVVVQVGNEQRVLRLRAGF